MLSFEEAARRWAAAKYDLDLDAIKSVDFEVMASGGGCPTCGPEIDLEITVWFTDERRPHTEGMSPHDLGTLLRELFVAGGVEDVTQ